VGERYEMERFIEAKGLKINNSKMKVMTLWKNHDDVERTEKWSCAVCEKGNTSKSRQCRVFGQ